MWVGGGRGSSVYCGYQSRQRQQKSKNKYSRAEGGGKWGGEEEEEENIIFEICRDQQNVRE